MQKLENLLRKETGMVQLPYSLVTDGKVQPNVVQGSHLADVGSDGLGSDRQRIMMISRAHKTAESHFSRKAIHNVKMLSKPVSAPEFPQSSLVIQFLFPRDLLGENMFYRVLLPASVSVAELGSN